MALRTHALLMIPMFVWGCGVTAPPERPKPPTKVEAASGATQSTTPSQEKDIPGERTQQPAEQPAPQAEPEIEPKVEPQPDPQLPPDPAPQPEPAVNSLTQSGLAAADVTLAITWVDAAIGALDETPIGTVTEAALYTSFAWGEVPYSGEAAFIADMRQHFVSLRAVLVDHALRFGDATNDDALAIFPSVPPAYAYFGGKIFFTPTFKAWDDVSKSGFGPKCRAAMLVHESIHVIDNLSGAPDTHISEWDEPAFSDMPPGKAIHNPSAYATFASQVFAAQLDWPVSSRYGAGKPWE